MPEIITPDASGLQRAVDCLRAHQPVVMPTETVYGLAAGTYDPEGLATIYQLKGRPSANPLIAHAADAAAASTLVHGWDDRAKALAAAFWPGPLTLILPRATTVPSMAAGGLDTLAIRVPGHPAAQALLRAFGQPLSAPSANRSGRVSPTCADHVADDYADVAEAEDLLVLDGGVCEVGVESTVLSLVQGMACVLRPGTVRRQQIEGVIGPVDVVTPRAQGASPGSSASHYAPRTPLRLITPDEAGFDGHVLMLPPDPSDAQAQLYGMLREADVAGHTSIGVVLPPDEPGWYAVRDRLLRAACGGLNPQSE